MRNKKNLLIIIFLLLGGTPSNNAIVPSKTTPLSKYEKAGNNFKNVGLLSMVGHTCTVTLIHISKNIGFGLTAAHCLTHDDPTVKCKGSVSFQAEAPYNKSAPIIGKLMHPKYVENKKGGVKPYDIGLVMLDLTGLQDIPTPALINYSEAPSPIAHVVGYGKTILEEEDDNEPLKRRALTTRVKLTEDPDHHLKLELEGDALISPLPDYSIPTGRSTGSGDSGGPVMDPSTHSIQGIVYSKYILNTDSSSEPLFPHKDWIEGYLKHNRNLVEFRTKGSGNASDASLWKNNFSPCQFANEFCEITPIIKIKHADKLKLDQDLNCHSLCFEKDGGELELGERSLFTEKVLVKAPTKINKQAGSSLLIKELDVCHPQFNIEGGCHALEGMHIGSYTQYSTYDVLHPKRGISLEHNGRLHIEGTLLTDHLYFSSYYNDGLKNIGKLFLDHGTLHSQEDIYHNRHHLLATHATIKGNYSLTQEGRLVLSLSQDKDVPALLVDGELRLNGGTIEITPTKQLELGEEFTLIEALEPVYNKKVSISFNPDIVQEGTAFDPYWEDNKLKARVVPYIPMHSKENFPEPWDLAN